MGVLSHRKVVNMLQLPQYGPSDYLQLLISGVSTGSIYVLIALGLITIYNVTSVVNLAQGEFVMLGAMLAIAYQKLSIPLVLAVLAAVVSVMVIGALVQRITVHPARHSSEVTLIIITIGTAIAIRGLALTVWGTTPYALPDFSPGAPVNLWGALLSRQRLWIMGTAAVVLVVLYLFFGFTLLGKAVRACAINRQASELAGINTQSIGLLAYAISAGMGAIGGIVIAPLTLATYDMGLVLGLKGFVVAIMGNMINAPAAVVGGLLLGVLESFTAGLFSSMTLPLTRAFLSQRKNLVGLLALGLLVGTLPFWLGTPYALSTMILIGIYTIVTIGLCLLMGYAGQVSLGQAAFFGLGAYGSAVLTTRFGWNPWLAMIASALGTGAVAHLIGIPIFRLRGNYLAMATLAFGVIVNIAIGEWKAYTGGHSGLPGIPRFTIGGAPLKSDLMNYYLVWAFVIVALLLALNIVNSRTGRALRAINGGEPAAESLGVHISRYKLQALTTSAVFASVAGSLYTHYMIFVSPNAFDFGASVRLVLMASVGGLASIWGAPFGTAGVILLTLILREIIPLITHYGSGEHQITAYGVLLVAIMIFMPEGLTVAVAQAWQRAGGLRSIRRRLRSGR